MDRVVNVEKRKKGFQRTHRKPVNPSTPWSNLFDDKEGFNPTRVDSESEDYAAYQEAMKTLLSSTRAKNSHTETQEAYLSPFEPFTEQGEWPGEHVTRSNKIDASKTEELVIYTDGSFRPRIAKNTKNQYEGSTSWAWVDLESQSWGSGALAKDASATSTYVEAYAILDVIANTPAERPLRIKTDSQTVMDMFTSIRDDPEFIPLTRNA